MTIIYILLSFLRSGCQKRQPRAFAAPAELLADYKGICCAIEVPDNSKRDCPNFSLRQPLLLHLVAVRSGSASGMLFDVLNNVTDELKFFRIIVRDLDIKLVLNGHNDLNRIQRVSFQIFHQVCAKSDGVFFHSELLDDEFSDLDRKSVV